MVGFSLGWGRVHAHTYTDTRLYITKIENSFKSTLHIKILFQGHFVKSISKQSVYSVNRDDIVM